MFPKLINETTKPSKGDNKQLWLSLTYQWLSFLLYRKIKSLDIWYVASASGPLPNLFTLCSWGPEGLHPINFVNIINGNYSM